MNSLRQNVYEFVFQNYKAKPEYLWVKFPEYAVFKHENNKNWFAIIMNVSKSKLGLDGDDEVDILDVKCDPMLVSLLAKEKGFLPAYHMSKSSWITILLDGSCPLEMIFEMIDQSFKLTSKH